MSKTDVQNLRKLIAWLREMEPHIADAEKAGLPLDELRARHEHLKLAGEQMLAVYEPKIVKVKGE